MRAQRAACVEVASAGTSAAAAILANGGVMIDLAKFKPKTVYVTYIAAAPEKVWQALTSPEFTKQYFFGRAVEIDQAAGGSFILRMPDGRVDVEGKVVECDPPRRLSVTWRVMWIEDMRKLPECLVTYEIEA